MEPVEGIFLGIVFRTYRYAIDPHRLTSSVQDVSTPIQEIRDSDTGQGERLMKILNKSASLFKECSELLICKIHLSLGVTVGRAVHSILGSHRASSRYI